MASEINRAVLQLTRRAEANQPKELMETFVSAGPLLAKLATVDHQILYGRRGTGKTHVLQYLVEEHRKKRNMAVYVDLRTIGSNTAIYADLTIPFPERGTRLLCDVLGYIYNELSSQILEETYTGSDHDYSNALKMLDLFSESMTDVRVIGNVERVETVEEERTDKSELEIGLAVSANPSITVSIGDSNGRRGRTESTKKVSGPTRQYVHFGKISNVLGELITSVQRSLWLILDEWSVIPPDLQPLLADMLRRSVMPVRGVTVKIGAIEMRSNFRVSDGIGGYIGFELGADISADTDLDDFMVFGNDNEKAETFFSELLFRHVSTFLPEDERLKISTPNDFILKAFTGREAFTEIVRAAEGIPRDAINIAIIAATKADDKRISVEIVRQAARTWYVRDKEKSVQSNEEANALLHWVIDEVIQNRRARAFLLEQGTSARNELISSLYDSRVIHVIKRNVAAKDKPGVRFDVYTLDFGCYVDLIRTSTAPKGLFEVDDDDGGSAFVEVPMDDYRSIRRAILDLNNFDNRP